MLRTISSGGCRCETSLKWWRVMLGLTDWSCLARCRRPTARGCLRPASTGNAVRPRPWYADSAAGHSDPLVRPEPTSLRPDQPSAKRRAQALSGKPRSGTGAVREAAQRHWRKPARNVLDSGSTVLRSTGREGAPHASKRRCFVKHSNLITGRKSHHSRTQPEPTEFASSISQGGSPHDGRPPRVLTSHRKTDEMMNFKK